jgi:hypothetical protein
MLQINFEKYYVFLIDYNLIPFLFRLMKSVFYHYQSHCYLLTVVWLQ